MGTGANIAALLRKTHAILAACSEQILAAGKQHLRGFQQRDDTAEITLGRYRFKLAYLHPRAEKKIPGGGIIVQTAENDFLIAGFDVWIKPFPVDDRYCEIVTHEELLVANGTLVRGRRLNGDELAIYFSDEPKVSAVRLRTFS